MNPNEIKVISKTLEENNFGHFVYYVFQYNALYYNLKLGFPSQMPRLDIEDRDKEFIARNHELWL